MSDIAEELGLTFGSALEDSLVNFEGFDGILDSLIEDFKRLAVRILIVEPLLREFKKLLEDIKSGGGSSGSVGGAFGSFFSNIFGGFFADGGFLAPGKIGVVGENGPELAFGGRSGQTIVPNGTASTGTIVNFNISSNDSDSFRRSMAQNEDLVVNIIRKANNRKGIQASF